MVVGIWFCTSTTSKLCCGGASRDLVQQATGLGVIDTLRSGGGLGSGVVLGPLGEATSSKTSLVGVVCWKGATCACCAGVRGTDAGNGGRDHVGALGVSSSLSISRA